MCRTLPIRSRTDGDALLVARFSAEANRLLERRIFAHSAVRMRVRVLGHVRVCADFVSSIVGGRPARAPAGTVSDSMRVLAQPIPLRTQSMHDGREEPRQNVRVSLSALCRASAWPHIQREAWREARGRTQYCPAAPTAPSLHSWAERDKTRSCVRST